MSIYYIKTENFPSRKVSVFHPTDDIIKFMEDDEDELKASESATFLLLSEDFNG